MVSYTIPIQIDELKEFKKLLNKEIVIYIISSSDNQHDLDKAKDFKDEVTDYYLKPMSGDEIKAIFYN